MLNAIIVLIIALSAVWVYIDATKHKIGKIPGAKGMFNMSAGSWAVVTLLLWLVGFPAYLIKRGSLISKAKEAPVEVSGRSGKIAALAVAGAVWTVLSYSSAALSALPACDRAETQDLVGQIISDLPAVKAAGVQFVSLKDIQEQGFNEGTQIRSCSATLVTTAGQDDLQYYIKWNDKEKTKFYVEAQIQ